MIPLFASPLKFSDLFDFSSSNNKEFKAELANQFKKQNIILTENGRNAIYLALSALKLKPNDEVIVPAYTCPIVPITISKICKPVFVDIDLDTFNIDVNKIEEAITSRIKAIIPIHMYGNPCNMPRILDIAQSHNLTIIEDCAQLIRSREFGAFGDYTILSFGFAKDINLPFGGALLTNNAINHSSASESATKTFFKFLYIQLAQKAARSLPSNLFAPLRKHALSPHFKAKAFQFNPSNLTLSDYQCELLHKQFKRMDEVIEQRRENARFYSKYLKHIVDVPKHSSHHTYFRYTIRTTNRDKLLDYLLYNGVEADKMYDDVFSPQGQCPYSELASKQILNIPVHHELSRADLQHVVQTILFFNGVKNV